jgi:hypothetical protein
LEEQKAFTSFVTYSQLENMVKKAILNDLVSSQDITSLEKHLVHQYLNDKKLDPSCGCGAFLIGLTKSEFVDCKSKTISNN